MQRFSIAMTSKGQAILPTRFRQAIGALFGDRLSLPVCEDGRATPAEDIDDLSSLQAIAKNARASDATQKMSNDPVGEYLVAEDERTKSLR